ncbi:MAG: hypothetical protein ACJAYB_000037 [Psychromonas sp.]|jgi:hypothetical protein
MTAPTITKQELIKLGADQDLISRFIEQTNNTDQPVDILSLIGAENATDDLLWLAGKILPKIKIVQFTVECAESLSHLHTDPSAIAAIQAARDWISEHPEGNRLKARDAAYAAANAAASAAASAAAYTAANAAANAAAYTAASAAAYTAANAAANAAAYTAAYAAASAAAANAANTAIYAAYAASNAAVNAAYAAYAASAAADYAASNEVVRASLIKMFSE